MKLYIFDYDSYGEYWVVMSSSPENALASLKKKLSDKGESEYEEYIFNMWINATLDNLPQGYTLITLEEDEVWETEHA